MDSTKQTQSEAQQPQEDKPTVYDLKPIETNLLVMVRDYQQKVFSAIISTIAIDRLGQKVSDRTQFMLNDDLTKMSLRELPPTPQPEAPKPANNDDAVKAAE